MVFSCLKFLAIHSMSNKKLIGNFVLVTYTSRCIVGHEYLRPYLPSVYFQFLCFFFIVLSSYGFCCSLNACTYSFDLVTHLGDRKGSRPMTRRVRGPTTATNWLNATYVHDPDGYVIQAVKMWYSPAPVPVSWKNNINVFKGVCLYRACALKCSLTRFSPSWQK